MRYEGGQYYVKSEDEMRTLFGYIPDAMENTNRIAERCNVTIVFGERKIPEYDVPQDFAAEYDSEEPSLASFSSSSLPKRRVMPAEMWRLLSILLVELERKLGLVFSLPKRSRSYCASSKVNVSGRYCKRLPGPRCELTFSPAICLRISSPK